MKTYKSFMYLMYAIAVAALYGCDSSDSVSNDSTSANFPYLLSGPRVTFVQNVYQADNYDVTVEVDVAGPAPIYSVNLWVYSKDDAGVFDSLDLQPIGGTTWSATTNIWLPKPPGNYYIDSIMIEDGDPFVDDLVRSGWYWINGMLSSSHYSIDQRLTNWSTVELLELNTGVSNIPITNFTLPQIQ